MGFVLEYLAILTEAWAGENGCHSEPPTKYGFDSLLCKAYFFPNHFGIEPILNQAHRLFKFFLQRLTI